MALMGVAGSFVAITLTSTLANDGMNETVKRMDRVIAAIALYKANHATSANPTTLAYLYSNVGAVACTASTASLKLVGWCGPYLTYDFSESTSEAITDGWGTAFEYNNAGFLYSWGKDRADNNGGGDDLTRTF